MVVKVDVLGSDEEHGPAGLEVVYVMFNGSNRVTPAGIPVDVKGWWEIHGLTFAAGLEVAYSLAADRHMVVSREPYMPTRELTTGCTFVVMAGRPNSLIVRGEGVSDG